jgi:hypothetical protein
MINWFYFFKLIMYCNPDIGLYPVLQTEHCSVIDTQANILSANRIFYDQAPSESEIENIAQSFQQPVTWLVPVYDTTTAAILDTTDLKYVGIFHGMILPIKNFIACDFDHDFEIKYCTIQDINMTQDWISVVRESFAFASKEQLERFLQYLDTMLPCDAYRLYVVYKDNTPVAGRLMIRHKDTATFHWMSTIFAMRGCGACTALTNHMVHAVKDMGCSYVALLASKKALEIDKKFGFQEAEQYKIYGRY